MPSDVVAAAAAVLLVVAAASEVAEVALAAVEVEVATVSVAATEIDALELLVTRVVLTLVTRCVEDEEEDELAARAEEDVDETTAEVEVVARCAVELDVET
jgi:hypothetical protein